ncbi:MAG: hypothetical protein JWM21_1059 [Acidobacteria bacterium]|nr:hypothetical protein [Acidobacteriota bacterium]
MTYIEELQDVIRRLHGTESTHVETVPVVETFNGQTIWEGEVEVFDLHEHPTASRLYAWAHDTDDPEHPKRPPAITPRKAVQVLIASDVREAQANAES